MRLKFTAAALLLVYQLSGQIAPQYGGIVITLPNHRVEAVLKAEGKYALYFSDPAGELIPASSASQVTLTVQRPSAKPQTIPLKLGDTGENWVGNGAAVTDPATSVTVSYMLEGQRYSNSIRYFSTSSNPLFHTTLRTYPARAQAGIPSKLSFQIGDAANRKVTNLDIVHERPMHLLVVSEDLAEFYHIHPLPSASGTFDVSHIFPHGGHYKLYADYTPHETGGVIDSLDLNVAGQRRPAVKLTVDPALTRTVGPYRVTLSSDKPLVTGTDLRLSFKVEEAKTGQPVHNLQRYLGAWAHIMLVSEDLKDFIHAHPYEPPGAASQNPSPIDVYTGFRRPGLYKLWIELQRNGVVTPVPFVFRVAGQTVISAGPKAPPDAVLVTVSSSGYQPARIDAKAGKPLKLAFYRVDSQNCGGVITFPDLNITQELPPGKTTIVTVVPRRTGPLSFACKMGMLKGQLIVR